MDDHVKYQQLIFFPIPVFLFCFQPPGGDSKSSGGKMGRLGLHGFKVGKSFKEMHMSGVRIGVRRDQMGRVEMENVESEENEQWGRAGSSVG